MRENMANVQGCAIQSHHTVGVEAFKKDDFSAAAACLIYAARFRISEKSLCP